MVTKRRKFKFGDLLFRDGEKCVITGSEFVGGRWLYKVMFEGDGGTLTEENELTVEKKNHQ